MLNITDEYSSLKDLCVCWGDSVPEFTGYTNNHPEYYKFPIHPWDKKKLRTQQKVFFEVLKKHGVSLHFIEISTEVPWQMYTRDTGFVINDSFYFCRDRVLPERCGEIGVLLKSLTSFITDKVIEIPCGHIEGGDVLVDQGKAFVGLSSRTSKQAADFLSKHVDVITLELGKSVMHLDTRMTILPEQTLLIYTPAFSEKDLRKLRDNFDFIEVTQSECETLGTNVFVINPETIVMHESHTRLIEKVKDAGFNVEVVDYSEPIANAGSFRCTTLPLVRQ